METGMTRQIHKMRARMKDGVTIVKLLVQHPMETGNRRDPETGSRIPRNFIRELRCEHNGTEVLSADLGWGVSRNPFLSLRLTAARHGDLISVFWVDNKGISGSIETRVK